MFCLFPHKAMIMITEIRRKKNNKTRELTTKKKRRTGTSW
jgi:hypothetical protein